MLSTRLESLVARHQRETKILTAARTLQKLNNANKRYGPPQDGADGSMSRQTLDSLEQSEKRTEAAEKVITILAPADNEEVLLLRDREASLRRRLMEHWSGVMAWEVRRLERISGEAQARADRASRQASSSKARADEMTRRTQEMDGEIQARGGRITALEEMVVEMGRRERAIEEEVRELDEIKRNLEREKAGWENDRGTKEQHVAEWEVERQSFERERQAWQGEKRMLIQDREAVVKARAAERQNGQMSEKDRAMVERVRAGLGSLLGKKAGVPEGEMADAVDDVRRLLERRENEVVKLKEEMREVNMGLEEEVRRVNADRDAWKGKAENVERSGATRSNELAVLEKQLRVGLLPGCADPRHKEIRYPTCLYATNRSPHRYKRLKRLYPRKLPPGSRPNRSRIESTRSPLNSTV